MASKVKLRRKIRKLKKRNLMLLIEGNDARDHAREWYRQVMDIEAGELLRHWPSDERVRKDLDG